MTQRKRKKEKFLHLKLLKFTVYNEIKLVQEDTVCFQIIEEAKTKSNKYGDARIAWTKLPRKCYATKEASKIVLGKKFAMCKLYDLTRNTEECITCKTSNYWEDPLQYFGEIWLNEKNKDQELKENMKNPFSYNPNTRVPEWLAGDMGKMEKTSIIKKVKMYKNLITATSTDMSRKKKSKNNKDKYNKKKWNYWKMNNHKEKYC